MAPIHVNHCAFCKRPEGPMRPGHFYDAIAANGMRLVHFWVCNSCAIPLGTPQGPSGQIYRGSPGA